MSAPDVTHRRVLAIALPVTLSNVTTPLLGLTDTIVIGQLGEAELLTGLSVATAVFTLIFWAFGFLRMGTSGLAAQALGAGDEAEGRAILIRALVIALAAGLALIVLQIPLRSACLALMGASEGASRAAGEFFDIRIWSAPFAFANYAFLGWLIGRGRAGLGMALQIGINAANILLCILFVTLLGRGVGGAALATTLAEMLGALGGVFAIRAAGFTAAGLARQQVLSRARVFQMLAVSRDLMIRSVAMMSAFTFFISQGARAGDIPAAANAVLVNFILLAAYFLDGFAAAAQQLCGQALGAHDRAGFRHSARLTAAWTFAFAGLMAALILIGGRPMIDIMTSSPAVREACYALLWLAALSPLSGAAAFHMDGVFSGAAWSAAMRNVMMASSAAFFAVWAATRGLGIQGLWIAILAMFAARGLGQLALYPGLEAKSFSQAAGKAEAQSARAS